MKGKINEMWNTCQFSVLPRSMHHGVSVSRTSACGDPINITSPPPPPPPHQSPHPPSPCLSTAHVHSTASTSTATQPPTQSAHGVHPSSSPAITASKSPNSHGSRAICGGHCREGVPLPDSLGVVIRAPAEPGLPTPALTPAMPMPMLWDDEDSEGPRKCARACVGSDTGEWFDVDDAVPVPVPTG
ncbi:hypothetical protein OG21DRAFT_839926 [Imleria badia]|nr:hypothetical protein OG21DRAFT_839926 [Imleria badia]